MNEWCSFVPFGFNGVRFFLGLVFFLASTTKKYSADLYATSAQDSMVYRSFRVESVNIRSGPGMNFPLRWTLKNCKGIPVRVLRTFDQWLYIKDSEKCEGWVRKTAVRPKMSGIVVNPLVSLKKKPEENSSTIAFLSKGCIGRVLKKDQRWYYLEFQDSVSADIYKGWVQQKNLWGVE
jgi:SH3-like domain-containing protein